MVNETAKKVWTAYFGNVTTASDCFGHNIVLNEYGSETSGGWELDHIWPINYPAESGGNVYSNIQPLFWKSNREKSNEIKGKVSNKKYFVQKISTSNGKVTGRMAITDGGEYHWAYKEPLY